jgi:hypothetical protein
VAFIRSAAIPVPPAPGLGVALAVAAAATAAGFGAAASAGLLFGAIDTAAPWVDAGVHVLVPILGAFDAALALVVPLALESLMRPCEHVRLLG